jgi:hypothetical protein
MTVHTINKPNWLIALGVPFLIFLGSVLITFSVKFRLNDQLLSNAILADLLITAPLVYYLAIRKTNISKFTVTRVIVLGLLLASFILKAQVNPILSIIKTWIAPMLEALMICMIVSKFYVANKKAKAAANNKLDFLMHCRSVMFLVVGNEKLGNIVASEIAVMYYAFFGSKDKSIDYKTKFSTYKENGLPLVLIAILSIFLIETFGVHFLLSLWNNIIAWTITSLSLYTCIQLFAHIRAIKARPLKINVDSFEVHNGLAGDAYIQFDNIERIEMTNKKQSGRESVKIALLKGLENHNIVVYLKKPIEVSKIFGLKKRTDIILFFVDRPKMFVNILNTYLVNNDS